MRIWVGMFVCVHVYVSLYVGIYIYFSLFSLNEICYFEKNEVQIITEHNILY